MAAISDPGQFTQLATALESWLDKVVIVGGWAHRLYPLHPGAQSLSYPPLATLDAGSAFVNGGPQERDQTGRDGTESG